MSLKRIRILKKTQQISYNQKEEFQRIYKGSAKKKNTNSEAFLQKNKKYKTNLLTPIIKNIKIIY